MPDPLLVATDLDRTLLFSPRATERLGGALPAAVVETLDGATVSELAHATAAGLRALPGHAYLVPTTTRTPAQLARIALPVRCEFAIAASGGVVLRDGDPDEEWGAITRDRLAACAPVSNIRALLDDAVAGGHVLRAYTAEDLFCYGIVDPERFAEQLPALVAACAEGGWRVAHQGRKVYLLPEALHKAHALAYVTEILVAQQGEPVRVLAAGDTALDLELLLAADRGWIPAGSELDRSGFTAPHVETTPEPGHRAAAHIVAAWLAEAGPVPAVPGTPRGL